MKQETTFLFLSQESGSKMVTPFSNNQRSRVAIMKTSKHQCVESVVDGESMIPYRLLELQIVIKT